MLDAIHDIPAAGAVPATLSIGVGKDAPGFHELFEYASLSIEMALSRGGDQAVVKNKFNFEFYGGRNKEMEKRTKVKSRVMANALGELIADSSYVFVMGHKFPRPGLHRRLCRCVRHRPEKGRVGADHQGGGQQPRRRYGRKAVPGPGVQGCLPLSPGRHRPGRSQNPAGGGGPPTAPSRS